MGPLVWQLPIEFLYNVPRTGINVAITHFEGGLLRKKLWEVIYQPYRLHGVCVSRPISSYKLCFYKYQLAYRMFPYFKCIFATL